MSDRIPLRKVPDYWTQRKNFVSSSGTMRGQSFVDSDMGQLPPQWRAALRLQLGDVTFVVYSYQTPIAWVLRDGTEVKPPVHYSQTTSKHQGKLYSVPGAKPVVPQVNENDVGCWIDGARGWRGTAEVIKIAWSYGMPHDEDDEKIVQSYVDDVTVTLSDGTVVSNGANATQSAADYILNQAGMADVAETWLNENVCPAGFYFHWEDGEFFLSRAEDDDE